VTRFILGRLSQSLLTLFVLSVLVFSLARLTGNPVDLMLDISAPPQERERMIHVLGLDQPLYAQYGLFLANIARGDLGTSIRTRQSVVQLLAQRGANTLELVVAAMLLALFIAVPLAVSAAMRKGSAWDAGVRVLALLGQSIPAFWAATVLILVFAVQLHWLPSGRKDGPESFILPTVTMALFGFVLTGAVRLLRGSMLDVLGSEFVKFARIKGVPERQVVWKHALRNALIPLVTFCGSYFGLLLGGSVVVESVFAWPGVGRLAYDAVQGRDYPVIQGIVLYVSSLIVGVNFLVDLAYGYIDPRIRLA
jgi:peptide/nickel transport system permease protein